MLKCDVYHRKMMFEVISIITKPVNIQSIMKYDITTKQKKQESKQLSMFRFIPIEMIGDMRVGWCGMKWRAGIA